MLLQSWNGQLILLPALPSGWLNGSVHGLRARGGITADLTWRDGALDQVTLASEANQTVTLRYRGRTWPTALKAGTTVTILHDKLG
jgi:alpha-L-fucosidase 2